ncbi:MAG: hypothetical protein Q4B21_00275, partial [Bacteroidia bacterium]|nr:hypothetical protein [Bacteroidia bacterium]
MPRIIIIIFTCIIFLEGCKSPLEKFIFTPLTTQELDKIVAQDKSFLHTYAIIEEKNNYVFTKNDSLRFQGITYLRLHNYIKEFSNKKNNALITSNARENWLYRYNRYNSQVDSVINFWENHIKANSPDSVCNINYLGHKIE